VGKEAMAESDLGDKTEAPTPRRREEARAQGTVARSPDLAAAVLLVSAVTLLKWFGPGLILVLKQVVSAMLEASVKPAAPAQIGQQALTAMASIGKAMAPLLVGVALVAAVVNLAQVGFFLNFNRVQPNWAALNPLRGWRRLVWGGQAGVRLLLNSLKMLLAGYLAYTAARARLPDIVAAEQFSFGQAVSVGAAVIYSIAMRVGIVLFVLALIDYFFQRYRIEKSLKMSKYEIKEEMRRMEMNPQVKQRRRQLAVQRHTQRLKKEVPKADVVVTNPTHFAVALKYDQETMAAPRVVAKGRGVLAQKIREIAVESGVPVLERKTLARALYRLVKVGQEIPEQFYAAVAEILAYVFELAGKTVRRRPQPAAANLDDALGPW
jgi:flagellar biosynthesis protein FlhB